MSNETTRSHDYKKVWNYIDVCSENVVIITKRFTI